MPEESTLSATEVERLEDMGLVYRYPDGKTYSRPDAEELAARLVLVGILDTLLGPSTKNSPLEFMKASLITAEIGDNRNASAFDRMFGRWKDESAAKLVRSGKANDAMQRQIRLNAETLRTLPK
jgi:hypothetical protein